VLVGTPGRIKDLLERGSLDLSKLNHVVLDEVDRMLDMGFADDVDAILTYRYSGTLLAIVHHILTKYTSFCAPALLIG